MHRTLAAVALLLVVAAAAFAHGGHAHTYMGTVTMLHDDGGFMIKTTDGKEVTVAVSPKTVFTRADNTPAKHSDLAAGRRVVVKMTADGKTAATVKMGD